MNEEKKGGERLRVALRDYWDRVWPWPLSSAVVAAGLGACVMYVLTPKKDYDEELRKRATERVMKDVREAKSYSADLDRTFQERLADYYAERKRRDGVVLDSSLSSSERIFKVQELEKSLLKAEGEVYAHPLARVANQRTIFLDFVINKPLDGRTK